MPTQNENQNTPLFSKKMKTIALVATVIAGLGLSTQIEDMGDLLKGDLLSSATHAPIDGFQSPITQVPNWKVVGYNSNSKTYNEFTSSQLIAIPQYDTSNMNDTNTALTYSTLHLGGYGDQDAFTASHTGTDIVAPKFTPVVAIANGLVIEKEEGNTGYGNNLSIIHKNAPSDQSKNYDDNKNTRDYISSYTHLSSIEAGLKTGDEVKRGEVIGYVGDTGTASTYHLHFLVQEINAPFYPYWGFTTQEYLDAGYGSFSEATNSDIGLANGIKYTIDSLSYIQNNSASGDPIPVDPIENDPGNNNNLEPETPEEDPVEEPEPNEPKEEDLEPAAPAEPGVDTGLFTFELSVLQTAQLANGTGSRLTIADTLGAMANLDESITLDVEVEGVGEVSEKRLNSSDFKNGKASIYTSSEKAGRSIVRVGKSTQIIDYFDPDEIESTTKLDLFFEEIKLYKGQTHTMIVEAQDINDNRTPKTSFPGVITFDVSEGSATFNPSEITSRDFKAGIAKIEVVVTSDTLKLRARDGAIVSDEEEFRFREFEAFSDVPLSHPNADAIYALKSRNIINGNPNGTFDPNGKVNRAAAAKVLMMSAGVSIDQNSDIELDFTDIEQGEWYVPTLQAAVREGIMEGYPDKTARPGASVNHAELSKLLTQSFEIDPPNEIKAPPYKDVFMDDWFVGYVHLVNRMNLRDVPSNYYKPAETVTRAELAEMANRLLVVSENHAVSYVEPEGV